MILVTGTLKICALFLQYFFSVVQFYILFSTESQSANIKKTIMRKIPFCSYLKFLNFPSCAFDAISLSFIVYFFGSPCGYFT